MKNTVLITGASGGIGLEFARLFAKDGNDLILVARNEERLITIKEDLEEKYNINALVYAKDLKEENAAEEVLDFVNYKGLSVDILINNAGFGDFGKFTTLNLQKQSDMIHLNVLTLTKLCRLFAEDMEQKGKGKIVNVSSIAAFQPGPLMAVYYATKAFVESFTEALSVEMKGTGVTFMSLCPGPTKTNFLKNANLGTSGLFKNLKNASSKQVAVYGYKKLKKNRVVVIHGLFNKIIVFSSRLAPRKIVRNMVYLIQK